MAHSKRGNVWLAASGLVVNSAGQWLVVKKKYGALKGVWSLPAGFVNAGETVDEAAVREVKEETGIDCRVEGMIGFRSGVLKGGISDNMAIFLLLPILENQLIVPELNEVSEVGWKRPSELKLDPNASLMIQEIAGKVIELGFEEIINRDSGERISYTSYKIFFK